MAKEVFHQQVKNALIKDGWNIITHDPFTMQSEIALEARYRNHQLIGKWLPCWEFHVEPD
jgi:mRNA-degrading endonuclease YafQ of YafQ-DinJ toxin-antitoxin module